MSIRFVSQRFHAWWGRPDVRAAALEIAPFALVLGAVWLKLSYFSFPPFQTVANDWDGWRPLEAVEATLASLATLLVLCAPLLLFRRGVRLAAVLLIDVLVTGLVLADVLHFRFYGDVISVSALAAAGQVGYVSQSILALLRPTDVILVADILVAGVLLYRARGAVARPVPRPHLRTVATRAVVAGVVLLAALPLRIVALDRDGSFQYGYFRFFGVQEIGLLNYHLYEAGLQLGRRMTAGRVSDQERARVVEYVRQFRAGHGEPSELFGAAQGSNVIFVMVESLYEFPIGLRIGGEAVTPFLNDFAGRSLYFDDVYDQTWEGTTSDGEFVSLQALHPLAAGAVPTTHPGNDYRGIPAVLAERGYDTFSAHAYWGDLWNMRSMHPNLGFERSYFQETYEMTEPIAFVLSDAEFFRQTMPRLEEAARPFMAYLMTISTHHPYRLPARHKRLRLGELEGTQLGDYLHAVHYVDSALAGFVADLERSGLLDESVLVVYGDHKAKIGDPDDLETLLTRHAGYEARRPGLDARYWKAENRLPLLIHLPGDRAAGVHGSIAGQIDIAPTVLGLLGIDADALVGLGRDLVRGGDSFVVLRNGSFLKGDTLCVAPDATVLTATCTDAATGAMLPAGKLEHGFAAASARLEISDLIHRGDLIPALATEAPPARPAGR